MLIDVILCKDCRYSKKYGDYLVCEAYDDAEYSIEVDEDDYCSRAETEEEAYQNRLKGENENAESN